MRRRWPAFAFVSALAACGGTRPPPPAPPPATEPVDGAVADEPPQPPMTTTSTDAPERSRPPSIASYDEAISVPEPIDIDDDHPHLTDVQLTSPMRGVLAGCRIPASAKLTIKTAVQNGRAIGVTVEVRLEKPTSRSARRPKPSPAAVKAERKAIAKIAACVDHNVRLVVWPPSRRRDSFTMEL